VDNSGVQEKAMSKAKWILLGVLMIALIALPFSINPYILQIFILIITYSMLALAVSLSFKVGLPRFDSMGWWAIGAYTTALLMQRAHMSFWLTLLIGGIIGVVLGWLIFVIVIPLGVISFLIFGLVLTIALQQVFGVVSFFGNWGGTGVVPRPTIGSFTFVNKTELYFLGLVFLAINILSYYALYNSKIGRAWNAIGSGIKLARSVGVDVVKYRMANVLIGNFFLALAGGYYVSYSLNVVPTIFGLENSAYVMMYVVIGGFAHSLTGPITGAVLLTFMAEFFRISQQYALIITAVITILIIVLLPRGILSLVDRWLKPWFTRGEGIERSRSGIKV
jgi:branched-chain amino acid transport system permease protein